MKYYKKLDGKAVFLSPMKAEDFEQYTAWMNDFKITTNLGIASIVFSLEKEKEKLEDMANGGYNFAIVLKENDQLIGNCSLFEVNQIHRRANIGLFIGDADNRGKGYGKEALELLLAFGFKVLNLNNILLNVFDFNEHAINLYKKLGFKIIGERREAYFINGAYRNEVYMDILAEEFESKILEGQLPEVKK